MLPECIWLEVLENVDPDEYYALARECAGVSREFYWLLKNSLTTIRVHRPVIPLCGVVWLHSRDKHFSRIKYLEGELVALDCVPVSVALLPPDSQEHASLDSVVLAVAFPARGVDLQAIFHFVGHAKRHPIKVTIIPSSTGHNDWYTVDMLSTVIAALGVEGFTVEKLQF